MQINHKIINKSSIKSNKVALNSYFELKKKVTYIAHTLDISQYEVF